MNMITSCMISYKGRFFSRQDGSFMVRFDKEGYEYHYPLTAWRVPKVRHFIAELEEGEMLNGRITAPRLFILMLSEVVKRPKGV